MSAADEIFDLVEKLERITKMLTSATDTAAAIAELRRITGITPAEGLGMSIQTCLDRGCVDAWDVYVNDGTRADSGTFRMFAAQAEPPQRLPADDQFHLVGRFSRTVAAGATVAAPVVSSTPSDVVRTLYVTDPETKELILRACWHDGKLTVEEAATQQLRDAVETDAKFGLPFSPIKGADRVFLDCIGASLTRQFRYLTVVTESAPPTEGSA